MFASTPFNALYAVWIFWGISWLIAALWADRTVARPTASEWRYRILTFLGWALLLGNIVRFKPWPAGSLPAIIWEPRWALPMAAQWLFVALAAAGCAFAWWGRLHLGRLWSASLTRKADHRVVDSGPYAIVRHPIYTGLLIGAVATVAIRANIAASVGIVIFLIGYWVKARAEEVFLSAELGPASYAAYRARVPMLIPFGPK